VQLYEQQLLSMAQATRPTMGLAGLRIDGGNLTLRGEALYTRLDLRTIPSPDEIEKKAKARKTKVKTLHAPVGALIGGARFSPQGEQLLLSLVYSDRVTAAIYNNTTGVLRELDVGPLNRVWGEPCSWRSEEELLCSQALHENTPPHTELGPKIRELKDGAVPTLAYSNLLRGGNDDSLFEHYAGIQVVRIDLNDDAIDVLPARGLIPEYSLSPDGRYLLSTPLHPPYSRLLPAEKFKKNVVVHDLESGEVVLNIEPQAESLSSTALTLGVREPSWHPGKPAVLAYINRQSGASGRLEDALVFAEAPFDKPGRVFASDLRRVRAYGWTSEDSLFVTDSSHDARSWIAYLLKEGERHVIQSGGDDHMGDPSAAIRTNGDRGRVLEYHGRLFFGGKETLTSGGRPRLTSFVLKNGSTETLWRSGTSEHAEVIAILDPGRPQYLLRSETPTRPPSFSVTGDGPRRRVTEPFAGYPQLDGVRKHLLRYRRADGVQLSAMLYLPPNYQERSKLPTVFWIYPRDVEDFGTASLPIEEPFRYFEVKGPSRFAVLTQGYALLDAPSMPIVGRVKSGTNDFLPQLEQSAIAAIDRLVRLGVSDPQRIAVMGRSYGAFATANLMAHTQLFKTGIAISGAYNRTLTPFGFQSETQTFWQNTDAYVNMSPFFFADQMKGSLLLLHGEDDDNPGTPVMQSERFYAALVGNGVRSRYVSFPFEGHQMRGRRAVLHSAAEIIRWLDLHLKDSPR
jgi:dipeptidyl aminopeptidase/acylaminoacyl peptidase